MVAFYSNISKSFINNLLYKNNMDKEKEKWHWMMDYCKENKIPPAQSWAWDRAEEAYNNLA
jgi:hypothetical protein